MMEDDYKYTSATMSNTLSKSFDFEESNEVTMEEFQKNDYKSANEALRLAAELAIELASISEFNDPLRTKAVQVFNACEGWNEDECELVEG